MKQPVKHQVRKVEHVLAVLELAKILRQVLTADVDVGAVLRVLP